ncbi:MAG: ribonuclease III [Alphaproteobacteria bacterium]|nr:ribonuclease III [Alphaproteobacteria bacterium]
MAGRDPLLALLPVPAIVAPADPSDALVTALGHQFRMPELLERALSHSSSVGEREADASYQRLEFLGDRVLSLVVAEMLFRRFETDNEGALARRHALMVDRDSLAEVARAIDLGRHVRMAPGEVEAGTRDRATVLADCCEAVIGALYLDGGLAVAARFVERHWAPRITAAPPRDAKTTLQEWAQARRLRLPRYRTVAVEGPAHGPLFTIEVEVDGLPPVRGQGNSKRLAEQIAAQRILDAIEERTRHDR